VSSRRVASALGALVVLGIATPSLAGQGRWSANLGVGSTSGLGEDFGNAPGSITVATGVFVAPSRHLALGVRLGRHNLGTITTIIRDLYGPGSLYREDYSQTLWEVSLNACRRDQLGRMRMDACIGAGPHLIRSRDTIVSRDSTGTQIPEYDFLDKRSELHVGYHLAIALDRPRALGVWGIGLEGTYHQADIFGGMFVTMALRVTLN
jgi:hypothetical protein